MKVRERILGGERSLGISDRGGGDQEMTACEQQCGHT